MIDSQLEDARLRLECLKLATIKHDENPFKSQLNAGKELSVIERAEEYYRFISNKTS